MLPHGILDGPWRINAEAVGNVFLSILLVFLMSVRESRDAVERDDVLVR